MLDVSSKISWHLSQRGTKNNHCGFDLERFSTECRKTKVITQPIRRKEISYESQSEFKVKTTKLPKARENAGDQVAVDFSFACNLFREWREYSGPIRERSKAKPKQSQITFDNLKVLTFWEKVNVSPRDLCGYCSVGTASQTNRCKFFLLL